MDDRKDPEPQPEQERERLTRRKLVYVAPLLMSKRLFYRASGCGKVNPLQRSCQTGQNSGS